MFSRSIAAALLAGTVLFEPTPVSATPAHLRVVDVGNGLCVVARTPDNRTMLYDAGDKTGHCLKAVKELVPGDIDLIVLSHSDQDHIYELPEILKVRKAGVIVHPGDDHISITNAIKATRKAIETADHEGATVWNLKTAPLPEPEADPNAVTKRTYALGGATVTLIAGWSDGEQTRLPSEPEYETGEHNNSLSIVVKYAYGGHSVLLTGDTVGRSIGDPSSTCKGPERIMVSRDATWALKSDILIGQHHGADNATSNCFIAAVKPEWVVFSAGHKNYRHPRNSTVRRLLLAGVDKDDIFRTDRGDNEAWVKGKPWRDQEWIYGAIKGCHDRPGDDDVDILLPDDGSRPTVRYRQDKSTC